MEKFLRCSKCGLVYFEPPTVDDYDTEEQDYVKIAKCRICDDWTLDPFDMTAWLRDLRVAAGDV